MKKSILIALLILTNLSVFAQNDSPVIKKTGSKIEDFVPSGWKLLYETKGDLNKDQLDDYALIIENTNPENLILDKNHDETLNINPRILLVLFKKAGGTYDLVSKNTRFIPSSRDKENVCLADPFDEFTITKGVLKIHLENFYNCGAWEIDSFNYTFRFQNNKLQLIGYDQSSRHRSSGVKKDKSINFSTGKVSTTTGGNEFNEKLNNPKTVWSNRINKGLLNLEDITRDTDMF